MKHEGKLTWTTVLALAVLGGSALSLALSGGASAAERRTYEITIENQSQQVITPPILAAHNASVTVFETWAPASNELATQAETGNPAPLADKLRSTAGVDAVVVGEGVLPPGQSVTLRIVTSAPYFTATGMLATTNDAFFGLKGVDLPAQMTTLTATIFDAGSEANNELCAYIPGPPCGGNTGNARAIEGAEGIVQPHAGLRGSGDLNAAELGWNDVPIRVTINPVADQTQTSRR